LAASPELGILLMASSTTCACPCACPIPLDALRSPSADGCPIVDKHTHLLTSPAIDPAELDVCCQSCTTLARSKLLCLSHSRLHAHSSAWCVHSDNNACRFCKERNTHAAVKHQHSTANEILCARRPARTLGFRVCRVTGHHRWHRRPWTVARARCASPRSNSCIHLLATRRSSPISIMAMRVV